MWVGEGAERCSTPVHACRQDRQRCVIETMTTANQFSAEVFTAAISTVRLGAAAEADAYAHAYCHPSRVSDGRPAVSCMSCMHGMHIPVDHVYRLQTQEGSQQLSPAVGCTHPGAHRGGGGGDVSLLWGLALQPRCVTLRTGVTRSITRSMLHHTLLHMGHMTTTPAHGSGLPRSARAPEAGTIRHVRAGSCLWWGWVILPDVIEQILRRSVSCITGRTGYPDNNNMW